MHVQLKTYISIWPTKEWNVKVCVGLVFDDHPTVGLVFDDHPTVGLVFDDHPTVGLVFDVHPTVGLVFDVQTTQPLVWCLMSRPPNRWSGVWCPAHPTVGLDMTETTRDRRSFVLRPPETKPTSVSSRPDHPKPTKLSGQTTRDQTDEYLTY